MPLNSILHASFHAPFNTISDKRRTTHPTTINRLGRLLPLLIRGHKLHLQRKNAILRLPLLISLPHHCSINRRSTNGAAFLCGAGVKSLVEAFGAEEMSCCCQ